MLQYGMNAYASDFVIDEENIWFVPFGYNYLCCYNLKQKRMKKRIKLPVENNRSVLYGSMTRSGNRLILIPFKADSTIVYDMTDEKMMSFSADEIIHEECYSAYSVENDNVWMIPWIRKTKDVWDVYIKKICLHDTKTEFIEVFPKDMLPKDRAERWLLNGNCVYIENNLYVGYRNYIIKINLDNGSREAYAVGTDKVIYTTMCMVDDERLCMMDIYGNAVIWNRKNEQVTDEIKNGKISLKMLGSPNGYGHREGYRDSVVYRNEYVWFLPSHADKVLQLDLKNNTLSEAWFGSDICGNVMGKPNICGQFSKAYIREDCLYVWNIWNESFFIVDIRTRKVEKRCIELGLNPDEFCSMLWECMERGEGICREELLGVDGLDWFIRAICADEYDRSKG